LLNIVVKNALRLFCEGLKLTDSSEAAFLIAPKNNSRSKGVVRTSGILVRYGSFSYGKEYFDVPGPVPGELKVVVSSLQLLVFMFLINV